MKTKEELLKNAAKFTSTETERLAFVRDEVGALITDNAPVYVTEELLRVLNNIESEVRSLKEITTLRLMHLLKQKAQL